MWTFLCNLSFIIYWKKENTQNKERKSNFFYKKRKENQNIVNWNWPINLQSVHLWHNSWHTNINLFSRGFWKWTGKQNPTAEHHDTAEKVCGSPLPVWRWDERVPIWLIQTSKRDIEVNIFTLSSHRGGTRALWDRGASHWNQWETLPSRQHHDIPAQRVGHFTACLWCYFDNTDSTWAR